MSSGIVSVYMILSGVSGYVIMIPICDIHLMSQSVLSIVLCGVGGGFIWNTIFMIS